MSIMFCGSAHTKKYQHNQPIYQYFCTSVQFIPNSMTFILKYTKTSRSTYIFVSAHSKLISFIGHFPNCLFVKPKLVNQGGIFLLFERAKLSLLFKAHQHFLCNHRMLFMRQPKLQQQLRLNVRNVIYLNIRKKFNLTGIRC